MLGKDAGDDFGDPSVSGRRDLRLQITEQMLKYFIQKVTGSRSMFAVGPRGHLHPLRHHRGREAGGLSVRRAMPRARPYLIVEPIAAAIGCWLPFAEPTANAIVTSAAARRRSRCFRWISPSVQSVRVAGDDMDKSRSSTT